MVNPVVMFFTTIKKKKLQSETTEATPYGGTEGILSSCGHQGPCRTQPAHTAPGVQADNDPTPPPTGISKHKIPFEA